MDLLLWDTEALEATLLTVALPQDTTGVRHSMGMAGHTAGIWVHRMVAAATGGHPHTAVVTEVLRLVAATGVMGVRHPVVAVGTADTAACKWGLRTEELRRHTAMQRSQQSRRCSSSSSSSHRGLRQQRVRARPQVLP